MIIYIYIYNYKIMDLEAVKLLDLVNPSKCLRDLGRNLHYVR